MEILQPSWRGTQLQSRKDATGKYMSMNGSKSLLFVPVDVLPDAVYRITLEVKSVSGNGVLYSNIFGNRNFDFPHCRLECNNSTWSTYDIDLKTRAFPKTLPLYFRIWRSEEGTGELCIRRIFVTLLKGEEQANDTPQLISVAEEVKGKKESVVSNPEKPKPRKPSPKEERMKKREEERQKARERTHERRRRRRRNSPTSTDLVHKPKEPKVLPMVEGRDGMRISVVISVFNRLSFFERTLETYAKQTFPKDQFEIVVVDDKSTQDVKGLCKRMAEKHGLNFQYILFDKEGGAVKPKGWTPALSNNIGFKRARGSVVIISGPETLVNENALELSWKGANEGYCIYGNVFRSTLRFVGKLAQEDMSKISFAEIEQIEGAKAIDGCTKGWWWYYVAVRKEHLLGIRGVDERFMLGIAGEDDDFARRMSHYGVPLKRDTRIVGIHQDHSAEDKKSENHSFRFDRRKWKSLRSHNTRLLREWLSKRDPVTNKNIDWGSFDAIIEEETF